MEESYLEERYLDQVLGSCLWLYRLPNPNLTFREMWVLYLQGPYPRF